MTRPALTIWYNTKCPVCDAGIDRQRNKLVSAVKATTIEFRDINVEPQALAALAPMWTMCGDGLCP
jgi:predicted DCC family thiol-disulfide oxidoreductase YuxK